MKVYIISLIIALNINGFGQIITNNYYGGCADDKLNDFIFEKSYIYMVGHSKSFMWSNLGNAFLIKLDTIGNVIWAKTYNTNYYDGITSIIPTKDGKLMVLGNSTSGSFCSKLDTSGNVIFTKQTSIEAKSIVQTFDKGFLLAGRRGLLKIDSLGNTIYKKVYSGGHGIVYGAIDGFTYLNTVVETQDTGFVVSGITTDSLNFYPFILRADKFGNTIWAKTYNINSESDFHNQGNLIIDNNGAYILTGLSRRLDSTWINDAFVIKINNMGNVIWSKTYKIFSSYVENNQTITRLSNGSYNLIGTFNTGTPNRNIKGFAMRLDSLGNVIWANEYDGSIANEWNAVIIDKADIILGGYATSQNNFSPIVDQTDINLLRIDSLGNSTANFQSMNFQVLNYVNSTRLNPINEILTNSPLNNMILVSNNVTINYDSLSCITANINQPYYNNNYKIFPNPAKNNITISQTEPTFHKYEIYNLNGKLVSENKITSILQNIDLIGYTEGMYIVKLIGTQKVEFKKIVVVE